MYPRQDCYRVRVALIAPDGRTISVRDKLVTRIEMESVVNPTLPVEKLARDAAKEVGSDFGEFRRNPFTYTLRGV